MASILELENRVRTLEQENRDLRERLARHGIPPPAESSPEPVSAVTGSLDEIHARKILDCLPAMVGYWDRDLRNRFGNHAYMEWFGVSAETLPGMHISELLGEKLYSLNRTYIEGALCGEPQIFERVIPAPDGSRIRHSLAHYIPDIVDGEVIGFIAQASDITAVRLAQAALRVAEEKLGGLFELSPLGIALTDMQGKILDFNEAFRSLCGYERHELTGIDYRRLTPPEYEAIELRQWESLRRSGRYDGYVKELSRKDGSRVPVQLSGVLVTDSDGESVIWSIVENISERRRQELDLRAAKEAAEAANKAKSTFLATMSHEIRTPINGMLGMAQLLLMHDANDAEMDRYARTILSSGQSLLTLLNDILDFSKVEAGNLELSRVACHPGQVVDETLSLFSELARSRGLALSGAWHGEVEFRCWTDPFRLRQMLSNFVSNAIKFTASGFVRVDAREGRDERGHFLEFTVSDSGIGIPEDKLGLLFKPFSQVDGSTMREFGGTGLGLSIVLAIARAMGGDAGVDSVAGKGSRFWLRVAFDPLPGAEPDTGTANPVEASVVSKADDTPRGHVLVVEDNATNRLVAEALLKKLGYSVDSVVDGQQAVDAIRAGERPDMILMDVQMPVMDGLTATRHIRQWESDNAAPRVPIVALTAGAFDDDRQRCMECGMDDFLAKPVSVKALATAAAKWIGSAGSS